jgi:Flp pilus assembly protein TadD
MNVTMLRGAGIFCALALSSGVFAQAVDESALEALDQAAPAAPIIAEPAGAAELRAAMRRISLNPSDADAMADAGNAALALGDANAALNFFTRANTLRPGNSRIVAGLATATVRTENPFEALRLFDQAVSLGANERAIALDRALAFDLLGNFNRAQQDYKLARTASISDDLVIRQAVSLSLAGQKDAADAMLLPLLPRRSVRVVVCDGDDGSEDDDTEHH